MNEKSCIGVVGIGKLGLPLALCIERAGYHVMGMDIREDYIKELQEKILDSEEPLVNQYLREAKRFTPTTSLQKIVERCDIIIFVIVTPGDGRVKYSTVHLESSLNQLVEMNVSNKHLIIGCTVCPGFFASCDIFKKLRNITVSYNPEFVAIGDVMRGYREAPFVLIGTESDEAADTITEIHRRMCKRNPTVHRMSLASAEITKLAINCFVTTKISFSNMIGDIADRTEGASAVDILKCLGSDPRIGSLYLKAGHGYGGPCFNRDNRALGMYASDVGVKPVVSMATDEYNVMHNDYLVETIMKTNPKEYVMDVITYKKGVSILEESQALVVAEKLVKKGVKVIIEEESRVIKELARLYPEGYFTYREIDS